MSERMRSNGKATGSETADVVIIGGGVNGMSTAFQLAKRGVRKVVVLERRQLGAGATGKSGALVRCHYANVHESMLTLESLRIFRHWGDEVGHGDSGFDPIGFVQVVSASDADKLRANVAAQQAIGVDTHLVDAAQLREIDPLINTDDLTVAAWEPNSGYADPNATLYGFAAAAEARGVSIRTETPALAVVRDGDRVAGVRTPHGTIATEAVLVAAGSWANDLLRPLGLAWGMEPVRTQVAIFRWPRALEGRRRHPVIIDAIHHSWLRPEGKFATLIGAERGVLDADLDAFDETLDARVIPISRDALAARLPVFANATMRGGWSGTFMRSADGHPIIDQVPTVPGLWVMAADNGSSFKTAPATGVCLAEWIVDGAPKLVDLTPFRSSRFDEDQPWIDPHAYGDDRRLTVSR
ncbi:MAG TPA: FAD-binding oxidoreductase [Thermomicrobiales bacterium]|nr:FAD-binding oxidoreductase [Thermomicrobiales bacterium]